MWFITVDLDLVINHLVGIVFAGFFHCKLTLSLPTPFHHGTLWKDITTCSLTLRCGELHTTSLRAENLHKLFGILLHWRFVYSPAFIYLLNNFFISEWTHRDLFYTFATNPVLLYFVAQNFPALATGNFPLAPVSLWYSPINDFLFVCFLAFPYFLALKAAPGSLGILPAPALELICTILLEYCIRRSWHLVPSLHGKLMRKQWKQYQTLFLRGLQNHCRWWLQPRN